jgi:SAM-dependent methyltransferase
VTRPFRSWVRELPGARHLLTMLRAGRRRLGAPDLGGVNLGDLGRLSPVSKHWGFDRGTPIDRHFVGLFLRQHQDAVRGTVLEIGDDRYTREIGGDRVLDSQVLHVDQAHAGVTMVGDLARLDHVPSGQVDCAIITQTLQFIPDVEAAVGTIHRLLRPGGVALVTVPAISRIDRDLEGRWATEWSFTRRSMARLFGGVFGADQVTETVYGNVLVATAFLHGLAAEELTVEQLTHLDPDFEVLVGVRAVRAH